MYLGHKIYTIETQFSIIVMKNINGCLNQCQTFVALVLLYE